jgi:hypothetical protein
VSNKEKESTENQILRKLKALEKRIKTVESSLKRIEQSSTLTTEDQLFFGFVFALLLVFLTLPDFDFCTIFEDLGVDIKPAEGIITTKMSIILLLTVSSIFRYLTALTKNDVERVRWRKTSVTFLLSCFYFLTMDLIMRGLSSYLQSINFILIVFAPMGFSAMAIIVGVFIEKKWYRYYGLTDVQPTSSFIFALLGLVITVAYYLAMITSLFIPISDVVAIVLLVSSVFVTALIIKLANALSNFFSKRRKKKASTRLIGVLHARFFLVFPVSFLVFLVVVYKIVEGIF